MSNFFEIVEKKVNVKKASCGLQAIDESIGGFTFGGNYLVSGHRKCGKSSLLVGFVNHWLEQNLRVAYLNSEMTENHIFEMLVANYLDKERSVLSFEDMNGYKNKFIKRLLYSSPDELRDNVGLSIKKLESELKRIVNEGARIVVVDNLTKLQESTPSGIAGYQNLAKGVSVVTTVCRQNNVLGLTVLHTKDELIYTETPEGIAQAVEDKLPEKIFQKSVTILRKPSSASIYGGGSTKTDLLGTLILWRPYMMFNDPEYTKLSSLIFEDFRGETPESIRLIFNGSKSKFIEKTNLETNNKSVETLNPKWIENNFGGKLV